MERSQHQSLRKDIYKGANQECIYLRDSQVLARYHKYISTFFSFFFFLQIKDLKEGEKYVFRVRAQNKAGVGKVSDVTEPVPALTKPGGMK